MKNTDFVQGLLVGIFLAAVVYGGFNLLHAFTVRQIKMDCDLGNDVKIGFFTYQCEFKRKGDK